ncbi:unnamed protein product [Closterium sp. Naga37s-1]|nr:unnamed protein product [Closterium sp. Naga37s-1]
MFSQKPFLGGSGAEGGGGAAGAGGVAWLAAMARRSPEEAIRAFEAGALAEYVRALVAVDHLGGSALLAMLQRGTNAPLLRAPPLRMLPPTSRHGLWRMPHGSFLLLSPTPSSLPPPPHFPPCLPPNLFRSLPAGAARSASPFPPSSAPLSSMRAPLRGAVGAVAVEGALGTASAPLHVVAARHAWPALRALRALDSARCGPSPASATWGTGGLSEEEQSMAGSDMRCSDVKGVDEAKAEHQAVVHHLHHPKGLAYPVVVALLHFLQYLKAPHSCRLPLLSIRSYSTAVPPTCLFPPPRALYFTFPAPSPVRPLSCPVSPAPPSLGPPSPTTAVHAPGRQAAQGSAAGGATGHGTGKAMLAQAIAGEAGCPCSPRRVLHHIQLTMHTFIFSLLSSLSLPQPNPITPFRSPLPPTFQIPRADDADVSVIARGTPGFSGADLANVVNGAALRAGMEGQRAVGWGERTWSQGEERASSWPSSATPPSSPRTHDWGVSGDEWELSAFQLPLRPTASSPQHPFLLADV